MIVYRARAKSGGKVFHTQECRQFPKNARQLTLEDAKKLELKKCTYCAGEHNQNPDQKGNSLAHKLETGEITLD